MIAALLKIVVGIIVSIAVVLVFALVYNSFYFAEPFISHISQHQAILVAEAHAQQPQACETAFPPVYPQPSASESGCT